MSAKGIIIAVVIVLVGSTGAYLALAGDKDEPEAAGTPSPSVTATASATPASDQAASESPGRYIAYSEQAVTEADGTRLIFFYAPWCPQCRAIESDIEEQGVPAGVTVFKADYDSSQDLRKRYGVTIQTTFVKVDAQGNEITKLNPYDEASFDYVKANLL